MHFNSLVTPSLHLLNRLWLLFDKPDISDTFRILFGCILLERYPGSTSRKRITCCKSKIYIFLYIMETACRRHVFNANFSIAFNLYKCVCLYLWLRSDFKTNKVTLSYFIKAPESARYVYIQSIQYNALKQFFIIYLLEQLTIEQ